MLSAPPKPGRRLSSLFSLGSSKDPAPVAGHPRTHSHSQSSEHLPSDKTWRKQRPALHHSASAQHLSARPVTAAPGNGASPEPRTNGFLTPPSSQALLRPEAAASSDDAHGHARPSSVGISGMPTGFVWPGVGARTSYESRSVKGRSWVPGKSRGNSADLTYPKTTMRAWVAGAGFAIPYELAPLLAGGRVGFPPRMNLL